MALSVSTLRSFSTFLRGLHNDGRAGEGVSMINAFYATFPEEINNLVGEIWDGGKTYTVRITGYSEGHKIDAIKAIRAVTGIGLKEAKDASESLPLLLNTLTRSAESNTSDPMVEMLKDLRIASRYHIDAEVCST